jgi:hypothetical protein
MLHRHVSVSQLKKGICLYEFISPPPETSKKLLANYPTKTDNAYKNLKGKRLVGRPRRRWEDNIGINLREIG